DKNHGVDAAEGDVTEVSNFEIVDDGIEQSVDYANDNYSVDVAAAPGVDSVVVETSIADEPTIAAATPANDASAEDDLIDEEILEIFIEEAGEVINTINEFFPKWA